MALTTDIKVELARVETAKACCRCAEITAMLRFAGRVQVVRGHVVVEAEFDTRQAADRFAEAIRDAFNLQCEMIVIGPSESTSNTRYLLRMVRGGAELARLTGLVDRAGRPVRGLPASVVGSGQCCQAAIWRGAFLGNGALTHSSQSICLEVLSPSPEAALALVGSARRLNVPAKTRRTRHVDRAIVRDADAISTLFTVMGAVEGVRAWRESLAAQESHVGVNRLANFDDANSRRSAQAAQTASLRVRRALEILGDDVPEHLLKAGELRLEHKDASLEELGQFHVPPLTKDAIAGRIRRLLAMADKEARSRNLPTTADAASAERGRGH